MIGQSGQLIRAAGAAAVLAIAAACGPTEYEPATGLSETGYTTTQLSPDRYLVSFEGNAATSRETVETFLLYRAAEVAAQSGHPYFALVEQETEREVDVDPYYAAGGLYGYGPGLGVGSAFGFPYYGRIGYGPPVGYGVGPAATTDSYEAYAAVQMFETRPADRQDVFATREVLTTLRDEIELE